ncbi:MAG: hypothetical protein ACERK1_00310 [Anaerolineales bacterium]
MAEGIMRLGTMGWLVLSGKPPEIGDRSPQLSEKILELTDLSKTPVCMTIGEMQDCSYLDLFEDLEILFGTTLQIIDLQTLPAEELRELWLDSSLKILGGGTVEEWYKILGVDLFKVRPEEILPEASVLLAIDSAAAVMGSWVFQEQSASLLDALGWVINGIILPGQPAPSHMDHIRDHISDHIESYAIGLPEHALLALGPEKQIEVWSDTPPTVFLGYEADQTR